MESGDTWKHSAPFPIVRKVYKISGTSRSIERYEEYRFNLHSQNFTERRYWYGTMRACNLGDHSDTLSGSERRCSNENCSLCQIVKKSYDVRQANRSGMFGRGIYTSAISSKSDMYTSNPPTSQSKYQALLLNKVVIGRVYKPRTSDKSLTSPPDGYDSVKGEPGRIDTLPYHECVVYDNDAIRPSWLVIYEEL